MTANAKLKRCIMVFPAPSAMRTVETVRRKHDPAAGKVRAHITLVFPFESVIARSKLEVHMLRALKGIAPFEVTLGGFKRVSGETGHFLFLKVRKGAAKLKRLHDALYRGVISRHRPAWLKRVEFLPHMTLGKFETREQLDRAYQELKKSRLASRVLRLTVRRVTVEIIGENGAGTVETEVNLGAAAAVSRS